MSPTLIVVIAAVLVIGFGVSIYNSMVKARNHFKNAFSQIDVQLKRRYDLIPNLVETAKGYMAHEKETLEAVVKARNTALAAVEAVAANPGNGTAMQSLGSAEGLLGQALGKFNIAMEAYPDLKADGSIQNVMEELTSTENKIAFSRQAFNDSNDWVLACGLIWRGGPKSHRCPRPSASHSRKPQTSSLSTRCCQHPIPGVERTTLERIKRD